MSETVVKQQNEMIDKVAGDIIEFLIDGKLQIQLLEELREKLNTTTNENIFQDTKSYTFDLKLASETKKKLYDVKPKPKLIKRILGLLDSVFILIGLSIITFVAFISPYNIIGGIAFLVPVIIFAFIKYQKYRKQFS